MRPCFHTGTCNFELSVFSWVCPGLEGLCSWWVVNFRVQADASGARACGVALGLEVLDGAMVLEASRY